MNPLNVYTGPDSIRSYFDPDSSPPLPLVEVPECLNPYREDGVRIYAKMMSMHPTNNVKSMPAMNLLQNSIVPGKTKSIVEYSSGSTVLSMSLVGKGVHGLSDVKAYLSNKTSFAKLRLMQLFGINITLFGGPSQPEPGDVRGGISAAGRLGETSESVINPNQYLNDNNWKAHVKWTGPQLLRQLPNISVICAGMGTSGTMTGLGTYFKEAKPSVFRLGVCTAAGERVPGPRSYALLAPVEFPWRTSVDEVEHVGALDSYSLSLELIRNGLICGPSSGLNLQGLYQMLSKRKQDGTLKELAGADGQVHCVFLCCDLPYQYVNEYFDKLDAKHFPKMTNEGLLDVDLHRYDEAWEKNVSDALEGIYAFDKAAQACSLWSLAPDAVPKPGCIVIDLRQEADFHQRSLPGAINVPFAEKGVKSPFFDPAVLRSVWTRLEHALDERSDLKDMIQGKRVLFVCYDGDTSRVANSVFRARDFVTDSVRGGFDALIEYKPLQDAAQLAAKQQTTVLATPIRAVVG